MAAGSWIVVTALVSSTACVSTYPSSERQSDRPQRPGLGVRVGRAILDVIGPVAYAHDTVYAPGFSEERFARVALGQDRNEVIRLLGTPLRTDRPRDGNELWIYSWHGPRSDHYQLRAVRLDRDGRVTEVLSYFYID